MNFLLKDADPRFYINSLTYISSKQKIGWMSANAGALVIRGEYGKDADEDLQEIVNLLKDHNLGPDHYEPVMSGYAALLMNAQQNLKNGGCMTDNLPARYTAYPVLNDPDTKDIWIYHGLEMEMDEYWLDIPLEISCEVRPCMQEKRTGFFKKEKVFDGNFSVTFTSKVPAGYQDGDLRYQVSDVVIPVTRQMMMQTFYVFTQDLNNRPKLFAAKKGLKLAKEQNYAG